MELDLYETTEDDTMMFYASADQDCASENLNMANIAVLTAKDFPQKKSPTGR